MDKEVSVDFFDSFEMLQYGMIFLHYNNRKIKTIFPYEDGWRIVYEGPKTEVV